MGGLHHLGELPHDCGRFVARISLAAGEEIGQEAATELALDGGRGQGQKFNDRLLVVGDRLRLWGLTRRLGSGHGLEPLKMVSIPG
jgi:hypothetical protein